MNIADGGTAAIVIYLIVKEILSYLQRNKNNKVVNVVNNPSPNPQSSNMSAVQSSLNAIHIEITKANAKLSNLNEGQGRIENGVNRLLRK